MQHKLSSDAVEFQITRLVIFERRWNRKETFLWIGIDRRYAFACLGEHRREIPLPGADLQHSRVVRKMSKDRFGKLNDSGRITAQC